MIQLRDARTSELLAEGDALEIAIAAEAFAKGEVLFDGVGEGGKFDPVEVRKLLADGIVDLQHALDELPTAPNADEREDVEASREELESTISERQDQIVAGQAMVADARQRLEEARSRR